MTSAEPVDLFVDIRAVEVIADDLGRLSDRLRGLASAEDLALDSDAAGSDELAEALRRFLQRWSFARTSLAERLDFARDVARNAVTAYETTERGLTDALRPSGERAS